MRQGLQGMIRGSNWQNIAFGTFGTAQFDARRLHQEFSACCLYCFVLVALVFFYINVILEILLMRAEKRVNKQCANLLRSLQTSSPTGASLLDAMERLEKIVLDATELALRQSAAPGHLTICTPQVCGFISLTPVNLTNAALLPLRYRSRTPSQMLQLRVFHHFVCSIYTYLFIVWPFWWFLTNLPMEPDSPRTWPEINCDASEARGMQARFKRGICRLPKCESPVFSFVLLCFPLFLW